MRRRHFLAALGAATALSPAVVMARPRHPDRAPEQPPVQPAPPPVHFNESGTQPPDDNEGGGLRAWGQIAPDGTLLSGDGVDHIEHIRMGAYRIHLKRPFKSPQYAVVATARIVGFTASSAINNPGIFDIEVNTYEPGQHLQDDYVAFAAYGR